MGLIIDTCVFIYSERNKTPVDFTKWEKYLDVYISSITVSELLVGVHRANSEPLRARRSIFVENIINEIAVLKFDTDTARIHANLYAYLLNNGLIIGAHDLIIAATAIANNCALLTANIKEFARIPNLEVVSYDFTL